VFAYSTSIASCGGAGAGTFSAGRVRRHQDMVVFDEHRVVQAEAVIEAAPQRTAYFSSRRSPGVSCGCTRSAPWCLRRRWPRPRVCVASRQAADEIQGDALSRQDGARRSFPMCQRRPGFRVAAVLVSRRNARVGVEQANNAASAQIIRRSCRARASSAALWRDCGPAPPARLVTSPERPRSFLQRAAHNGLEKQRMGRAGKSRHARLLVVVVVVGSAIMRSACASVRKVRPPDGSVCG